MKTYTRLSYFWIGFLLVLVFALPGCQTVKDMLDPDRSLNDRLRDADIVITATYDKIAKDATDGILTKDEALALIARVDEADRKLQSAKLLLKNGDAASAEKVLDLANSLLTQLRADLAEKARREK